MVYRTHNCNQLRKENIGEDVILSGWIHKIRNHGALSFIDLRDRYGITQITVNLDKFPYVKELKRESVIKVKGKVVEKPEPNKKLMTGEIEVSADKVEVLSSAETLPIDIDDSINTSEDMRLKYRYLDIRTSKIKENLILRSKVTQAIRKFLDDEGFIEVETPVLARSTPEGARDFLVPSRRKLGDFFALPQSPQLFKQLLMVGGMDKYFQIAKCFRDEDLRADRQLEFTQIDIEMSFVEQEDVLDVNEKMMKFLFKDVKGIDLEIPFPRISYEEAMEKYGSDKPDLRFGLEMNGLTDLLKKSDFGIFQNADYITGLKVNGEFSRKKIDAYTKFVQEHKAKGLVWFKFNGELEGSAVKFLNENIQRELIERLSLKENDYLFVIADKKLIAQEAMGQLRLKLGNDLGLIKKDEFKFVWILDFPLFEWSEEKQRYLSMHHPFTMPNLDDLEYLKKGELDKVRSIAHDLALNGSEIGGGSIRIHLSDVQKLIFKTLGLSEEEAENKFGFLLNAFKYGVPPHGGIAYGLDRLVAIIACVDSIRDVIAFPRNKNGFNPFDESPNKVDKEQLDELHIMVKKDE